MNDILKNLYKSNKGNIKEILNEYEIPTKKHKEFLEKLDFEISLEINDVLLKQSQKGFTSEIPFDEYKKERDLKDKYKQDLEKLKEKIKKEEENIYITEKEQEFLRLTKNIPFYPGDYELTNYYNEISSLMNKKVLTRYNKDPEYFIQNKFNLKLISEFYN